MLKVFRDNLKHLSWVLWLVIIVFVLLLFTDYGPTGQEGINTATAATVGKYEITYADFERAYRQQEQQLEQVYGDRIDPDLARQMGLHNQVLDFLIAEKILEAEGERMGVRISDEEVRQAILDFPVFNDENGNFIGQEAYLSLLRNNRMTADGFESTMRQDMLVGRVRSLLNQNVYVSDAEVEESYREQVERAKIRFVRLGGADFADQVSPSEAQIGEYFAANANNFEVSEKRVADYLLIDWAQLRSTLDIPDADIAAYYRDNESDYQRDEQVSARHILVRAGDERSADEARARIAQARARIEGGEDFAAVAAELSDDPGSKDRGGDLGTFGRGQMVPPFEEAAFSASAGDLVGPVETSFGVHLIEVLNRTQGGVQPLDEVATSISNRLAAERAQALAETTATELAERIEREGLEDFESLADPDASILYLTTDAFAEDEVISGIGRANAFAAAAFGAEVGESVGPVQIPRGWVVLKVAEIEAAHVPELADVESDVRAAVIEDQQVELAKAALEAGRTRLLAGTSFDDVAGDLGVEVEESPEFGLRGAIGSLGNNRSVAEAALGLDVGEFGGPVGDTNSAVLFEVVERQRFDPADFESEKETTRTQLAASRANEMLSALITARREEMGVVYDDNFLENFQLTQG